MMEMPELSCCIPTIKRGHYGLLEAHAKLAIFRELIAQAIATDLVRKKLDEYIEERQALSATKRGEAIEEGRKKREQKELLKAESAAVLEVNGHGLETTNTSDDALGNRFELFSLCIFCYKLEKIRGKDSRFGVIFFTVMGQTVPRSTRSMGKSSQKMGKITLRRKQIE